MTELANTKIPEQGFTFETVVKNNLHFWLRNFTWQQYPNVETLIIEKENLDGLLPNFE